MANCCNSERIYMGTGRTYRRPVEREPVSTADCNPPTLCEGLPLFTSYMTPQPYTGLLCPETALSRGSSFTNLYSPWPTAAGGAV